MEMRSCIYPGTFDPITNGHLDIIKRSLKIFDKTYICVAKSRGKSPLFSQERRIEFIKIATKDLKNVEILGFDGLLVDMAKKLDTKFIIRGLRTTLDFEYESQMDYANKKLFDELEIVYLLSSNKNRFISSTLIRSIFEVDGDISSFLPQSVNEEIKKEKICL